MGIQVPIPLVSEMIKLPRFRKPPLNEVAFGVQFYPLSQFTAAHVGLLWEQFGREAYPTVQDVAPLQNIRETFEEDLFPKLEFSEAPELPRTWFVHRDDSNVIQFQRDRLLTNWRKRKSSDEYPHFSEVRERFRKNLECLTNFASTHSIGKIEQNQFELTYVNHLEDGEDGLSYKTLGICMPDLAWRNNEQRFLNDPQGMQWKVSFMLPELSGRLHVSARQGIRRPTGKPLVTLELVARGFPVQGSDASSMWRWFDVAHEWIVRAFCDLTSSQMQQEWGRYNE